MARHEVVIHENTGALREAAPYVGSYISKEQVVLAGFAEAVGAKCGLPPIQVIAIIGGAFEAIAALESDALVRVRTDIGVVCGVITGSFPTADAAFDPARNVLELALRLDEAIRLDLADTVPTIITDEDLTKLRVDNVMDLAEQKPMNLIHGKHTFRVAGFNMVLSDEGAAVFLQNALGTTFALVIDRVVTHQLFEAHTAELLPPGDYKLVVKSRAGDAAGPLQTSFRKVKYLRVEDPPGPEPVTVTITGIGCDDDETYVQDGSPILVFGTGLNMGEGDALYMKRSDLDDEGYHQVPAWAIGENDEGTQFILNNGDGEDEQLWEWIGENVALDTEHSGMTLKLVSHGGVPASTPQTVTANAQVLVP